MADLFTRTYTFVDGTTAYGSQVEAEIGNIVTLLNNLNTAATMWGQVSALNASSVPLIADCSAGSQHIADFKNNSVIKASIGSTGIINALNGVTVSGASLTMSGQTIAMGANKITGVANGTADTDVASFGQYRQAVPNILDNGGFEIWQRGTTFTSPANATYGADRWRFDNNEAATATITKEVSVQDTGLAAMKVVLTGSGASKTWYVTQQIENYADYRGKTITASVRINANVASTCRVQIYDGVTTTTSSYHTGGSAFETITVSATIGAAITQIQIQVGMVAAGDKKNGTYYFDSAMVALGSEAVSFVPTNPQVDLSRCQRFYQRYGGNIGPEQITTGMCYTTTNWLSTLTFRVQMRIVPTATVTGTVSLFQVYNASASTINCATVVANTISVSSCDLAGTVASGLVAGNATTLLTSTTAAFFEFSADL